MPSYPLILDGISLHLASTMDLEDAMKLLEGIQINLYSGADTYTLNANQLSTHVQSNLKSSQIPYIIALKLHDWVCPSGKHNKADRACSLCNPDIKHDTPRDPDLL